MVACNNFSLLGHRVCGPKKHVRLSRWHDVARDRCGVVASYILYALSIKD